jgi:hypothetical protein
VDPVPDPLLLRKSGSAGNRIRDLCICSQKLRPLDHRGGRTVHIVKAKGETLQPVCAKRCKAPYKYSHSHRSLAPTHNRHVQGQPQCAAVQTCSARWVSADTEELWDRLRPASSVDVASVLTRYTNCHLYSAQGSFSLQCLY